jgi:insulysin
MSIDIRQTLFEYHRKYYSANLMTLAVLGSQSLDELQATVEALFSPIQNKNEPLPRWPESPYTSNERQVWINVLPVKDLRELHIVFPFPDTTSLYLSASEHYIVHLLGHEGRGSLLSLLKKKNWVNELAAETTNHARGFGSFNIELELTKDGLRHAEDIVTHVFQV